jgi:hypothetical protein
MPSNSAASVTLTTSLPSLIRRTSFLLSQLLTTTLWVMKAGKLTDKRENLGADAATAAVANSGTYRQPVKRQRRCHHAARRPLDGEGVIGSFPGRH